MEIHQALTRSETVSNILCRHEQVSFALLLRSRSVSTLCWPMLARRRTGLADKAVAVMCRVRSLQRRALQSARARWACASPPQAQEPPTW
jgi:hypothetical protein